MRALTIALIILGCALTACGHSVKSPAVTQTSFSGLTPLPGVSGGSPTVPSTAITVVTASRTPTAEPTATATPTSLPTCPPPPTATIAQTPAKPAASQSITGVFISAGQRGPGCLNYYRLFWFFADGTVLSTFVGTTDIATDWPRIRQWFYAGNHQYQPDAQMRNFTLAETFEGTYTLTEGALRIEIWQRTLYVDREIAIVGDHWYQIYQGTYGGNQILFDYYDREGATFDTEALLRAAYEYEYTRLAVPAE